MANRTIAALTEWTIARYCDCLLTADVEFVYVCSLCLFLFAGEGDIPKENVRTKKKRLSKQMHGDSARGNPKELILCADGHMEPKVRTDWVATLI